MSHEEKRRKGCRLSVMTCLGVAALLGGAVVTILVAWAAALWSPRGLCLVCAFPVGGAYRCPECGTPAARYGATAGEIVPMAFDASPLLLRARCVLHFEEVPR